MKTDDTINGESTTSTSNNIFGDREEYLDSLQKWLQEARMWQNICAGFPYYYLSLQQSTVHSGNASFRSGISSTQQRNQITTPEGDHQHIHIHEIRREDLLRRDGCECVIPPLWKRLAAEAVDFGLLFLLKMIITFILLESFDIIDFEKYNFETFQKNLHNPALSFGMTVETFAMELFHRIFVCCYEAYFLKGGLCATPGKSLMGICVVRAKDVRLLLEAPQEIVYAIPCQPLGFRSAFFRSVLKSVLVSLIFPMYLALLFFKHNRTGYDVICNTLVVEATPNLSLNDNRRPNI